MKDIIFKIMSFFVIKLYCVYSYIYLSMKDIIRGVIIGIGKIIPGVSGSVIAINLGIYEKAISCITNFFSDVKNNMHYLGKLSIGVIISISLLSGIIVYFLDNYYLLTMMLFVGLIIGSTNKDKNRNEYNYISLISFSIVLLLGLITKSNDVNINNHFIFFLYLIIIGFIDAATMIIPGISGTALLMMLGAYNLIIKTYSSIFSINNLYHNISVLMPFGIGIVIGILLTSKFVNYCFKSYYKQSQKAIKGFLWGTIVYMIITSLKHYNSLLELLLSCVIGIIGYFIIKKVNHFL